MNIYKVPNLIISPKRKVYRRCVCVCVGGGGLGMVRDVNSDVGVATGVDVDTCVGLGMVRDVDLGVEVGVATGVDMATFVG